LNNNENNIVEEKLNLTSTILNLKESKQISVNNSSNTQFREADKTSNYIFYYNFSYIFSKLLTKHFDIWNLKSLLVFYYFLCF